MRRGAVHDYFLPKLVWYNTCNFFQNKGGVESEKRRCTFDSKLGLGRIICKVYKSKGGVEYGKRRCTFYPKQGLGHITHETFHSSDVSLLQSHGCIILVLASTKRP